MLGALENDTVSKQPPSTCLTYKAFFYLALYLLAVIDLGILSYATPAWCRVYYSTLPKQDVLPPQI
jgi:hypothetical protein